ncbi:MAG TPA: TetR family transcriptional regulator [Polyangiaceae bacterium]
MKIRELERVSGVHRSTIHHYVNLGLLPRPKVAGPKLHVFGEPHVQLLLEIQKRRAEGWALPRIREHLRKQASKGRATRTSAGAAATDTRQQILEHATRLFAQRGYHGVRLMDVARSLGIGKATLYRYFTSKQALFVECVERVRFTLVPKETRELAERQRSLPEQGRGRAHAVLVHFKEYRALTHFLGTIAEDADRAVAARAKAELHSMITNAEPYLKQLMSQGARVCDSELLAYMLWGALMGAGERLTLDSKYSLHDVLDAYLQFTMFGMFRPQ